MGVHIVQLGGPTHLKVTLCELLKMHLFSKKVIRKMFFQSEMLGCSGFFKDSVP